MLPPRLRLPSAPTLLSASRPLFPRIMPTYAAARWGSIFTWRKATNYNSHLDPKFQRFVRYRTLKTRARLIEKIRRHGRWEWDDAKRPFFTSRQTRLASHWNGTGRPRWTERDLVEDQKDSKEGEDGYALSQREKTWNERMEWLKQRAEMDPYELVFGKRVEPFWQALTSARAFKDPVKPDQTPSATRSSKDKSDTSAEEFPIRHKASKATKASERERPSSIEELQKKTGATNTFVTSKKTAETDSSDDPNGQLTNYSYASSLSTSWNSLTNKTQRTEWDSISGETRRYEYDPISNRMIRVELPETKQAPRISTKNVPASESIEPTASHPQTMTKPPSSTKEAENQPSVSGNGRRAIMVPMQTTDPGKRAYFPSLVDVARKPSPTVELPDEGATSRSDNMESLTADEVRASMGRGKMGPITREIRDARSEAHEPALPIRPLQPSLDRLGKKEPSTTVELDDSAAHESTEEIANQRVPSQWNNQVDLLQSDRISRTRSGMSSTEFELWGRRAPVRWVDDMNARKAAYEAKAARERPAPTEADIKKEKADALLEKEIEEQNRRMQAHELHRHNRRSQQQANESGSAAQPSSRSTPPRAPIGEPELLQAVERVRDSAEALQRSRQKLRDQRMEMDTAFKQSSIQSAMHVERIQKLEADLEKFKTTESLQDEQAQSAPNSDRQRIGSFEFELGKFKVADTTTVEKGRYEQKIRSLREELDRTFKQSALQGEMHVERIRDLEQELKAARKPKPPSSVGVEAIQGEGDFCQNVVKHAKDDTKWYKRPAYKPAVEQLERDADLVKEVKGIYEKQYGAIDMNHRQASPRKSDVEHATVDDALAAYEERTSTPQAARAESKVEEGKLGDALADYDQSQKYGFNRDAPEKEIPTEKPLSDSKRPKDLTTLLRKQAAEENAAHEAQTAPGESTAASNMSPTAASTSTVAWAEPPVYKILAYDAGNDMIVTATSSSSFAGNEAPISVQKALEQLYRPDRFLPSFAGLQKEGFQATHSTKDLLVFRKVKQSPALEDHGLVGSTAHDSQFKDAAFPPGVNPVDGTGRSPPEAPDTGSFASPTGFVGDRYEAISHEDEPQQSYEDSKTFSPVKRQERVFSGPRSVDLTQCRSFRSRLRDRSRAARSHDDRRRRGWRSRAKWALSVGFGAAGLAYTVGAIAERKQKRDRERWEAILEGRGGRWE